MKILAVSDAVQPQLCNLEHLRKAYGDANVLVSCGDMPVEYLDFIASALALPLLFVRGNHDTNYRPEHPGGDDLHLRFLKFQKRLFVGLEGSICYNKGDAQYTQGEMMLSALRLLPRMVVRRARTGYGVHVLVTHSPPRHIHDIPEDYAHHGFNAFRMLMRVGRPMYLLHGHVDTWDTRRPRRTVFAGTTVLNVNPYMMVEIP